mgnify:FL=1
MAQMQVGKIRIVTESETGTSRNPARVLIYEEDKLVAEVVARTSLQQGADGGYYDCIILESKQPQ